MEFKDIEKKENGLMHRVEVSAVACFEGATPSNKDVQEKLAGQVKLDPKLTKVKHIYTRFGENCADVLVFTYDNLENYTKVEGKSPVEEKPAEEKAEEAAPAEEKAEATKEEAKEEPKAEEKPAEEKKE